MTIANTETFINANLDNAGELRFVMDAALAGLRQGGFSESDIGDLLIDERARVLSLDLVSYLRTRRPGPCVSLNRRARRAVWAVIRATAAHAELVPGRPVVGVVTIHS